MGVHFHIGKRPEVRIVLSFAICVCANNPMGHYMYSYITGTCTYLYVECSHFAREGSILYTESQSDET